MMRYSRLPDSLEFDRRAMARWWETVEGRRPRRNRDARIFVEGMLVGAGLCWLTWAVMQGLGGVG